MVVTPLLVSVLSKYLLATRPTVLLLHLVLAVGALLSTQYTRA